MPDRLLAIFRKNQDARNEIEQKRCPTRLEETGRVVDRGRLRRLRGRAECSVGGKNGRGAIHQSKSRCLAKSDKSCRTTWELSDRGAFPMGKRGHKRAAPCSRLCPLARFSIPSMPKCTQMSRARLSRNKFNSSTRTTRLFTLPAKPFSRILPRDTGPLKSRWASPSGMSPFRAGPNCEVIARFTEAAANQALARKIVPALSSLKW